MRFMIRAGRGLRAAVCVRQSLRLYTECRGERLCEIHIYIRCKAAPPLPLDSALSFSAGPASVTLAVPASFLRAPMKRFLGMRGAAVGVGSSTGDVSASSASASDERVRLDAALSSSIGGVVCLDKKEDRTVQKPCRCSYTILVKRDYKFPTWASCCLLFEQRRDPNTCI